MQKDGRKVLYFLEKRLPYFEPVLAKAESFVCAFESFGCALESFGCAPESFVCADGQKLKARNPLIFKALRAFLVKGPLS